MTTWELVAIGMGGYLLIGFLVDFYTAIVNTYWQGWESPKPEQFFRDMIRDVQWHLGAHVAIVLCWLLIFLTFLYWFLKGGVKVLVSGRKRERVL